MKYRKHKQWKIANLHYSPKLLSYFWQLHCTLLIFIFDSAMNILNALDLTQYLWPYLSEINARIIQSWDNQVHFVWRWWMVRRRIEHSIYLCWDCFLALHSMVHKQKATLDFHRNSLLSDDIEFEDLSSGFQCRNAAAFFQWEDYSLCIARRIILHLTAFASYFAQILSNDDIH